MAEQRIANFEVIEEREVGLRLPDGTEIYGPQSWHDHDPTTEAGRSEIITSLVVAAGSLGMTANDLIGQYAWIVRINRRYVTTVQGETERYPLDNFQIQDFVSEQNEQAPSDLVPEMHE